MIRITDDLVIIADKYQYILGKPRARSRKGWESAEIINPRYFPTLGQTIKCAASTAIRGKVADGSIQTLKEWLQEYAAIEKRIQELVAPFEEK